MNKLSVRLALRITGLFIVFSLLVGVLFFTIYEKELFSHFEDSMIRDLNNIGELICSNLSTKDDSITLDELEDLKDEFLLYEELTDMEIFILDKSNSLVNYKNENISYEASSNLEEYVSLYNGKDGKNKENILKRIKNNNKDYFLCGMILSNVDEAAAGMLILSTTVDYYDNIFLNVVEILAISIFSGIILMALYTVYFSKSFVRPIERIKDVSVAMTYGNYNIKTGIDSGDEIGKLASSIEVLAEQLEKARVEAEKLEAYKRDFLSKLSHELRTPITIMRGTLDLMISDLDGNKTVQERCIRKMNTEIILLQKMINELFDLTRLQTPEFKLNFTEFDFVELLGDVLMSAVILAKNKNIKVECSEPEKEILIYADYDRLRQLIMILIDNSIKYSPEGSRISLILDENIPSITVKDNGNGIEKEKLKEIFEPYYRADIGKQYDGAGLGLAIAAEIAKHHGFRISAESEIGKGSSFTLLFYKVINEQ